MSKKLMLGTAQWGWTITKPKAFELLEAWMAAGERAVDVATNYPINKNPNDFRAAEQILTEFIKAHGVEKDLDITVKIGSLNNLRTPDINLSPSFIQMMGEEYLRIFQAPLKVIMFHWDNRQDQSEIMASLSALKSLNSEFGIRPGLSGIAFPEVYAAANQTLGLEFDIQLKHNILQTDLDRYMAFQGEKHRIWAYGINAGGIKLDEQYSETSTFLNRGGNPENAHSIVQSIQAKLPQWNLAFVRPPVKTMNHIGLIYALLEPSITGVVLGLSSIFQLKETLEYRKNIETYDYLDVKKQLDKLKNP